MKNRREGLDRVLKVVCFSLLIMISFNLVISSPNPVGMIAFIVIAWVIGSFFWKRRQFIKDWSDSFKPLSEYMADKKKEEEKAALALASPPNPEDRVIIERNPDVSRMNTLDSAFNVPLSETENKKWSEIIEKL